MALSNDALNNGCCRYPLTTFFLTSSCQSYQILNCDDHANFLRRHNKDPTDYRPDILHQALLSILDSPLNKAGRIKAVYVNTQKNVLFKVGLPPHSASSDWSSHCITECVYSALVYTNTIVFT